MTEWENMSTWERTELVASYVVIWIALGVAVLTSGCPGLSRTFAIDAGLSVVAVALAHVGYPRISSGVIALAILLLLYGFWMTMVQGCFGGV
jgi:hypothetical protein